MVEDNAPMDGGDDEQFLLEQEARYPRPLPRLGDKVFRSCADPTGERTWYQKTFSGSATYLSAYQSAAHALFDEVQRQRTAEGMLPIDPTHWLLYPIYFCYRHALELSLKELSRAQAADAGIGIEAREKKLSRCHDLLKIWEPVAAWVRELLGKRLQNEVVAFEQLITDISEHDPSADAGRYHTRKLAKNDRQRDFPRYQESFAGYHPIDLDNLRETCDKMLNFIRWIWSCRAERLERAEHERWWLERLYRQ